MKLYVLINNKLTQSQKAVQSGHVVAKFASKHPDIDWDNQVFVYLKVSDFQIKKYINDFTMNDINYEIFREPDLNNMITAITCLSQPGSFDNLDLI